MSFKRKKKKRSVDKQIRDIPTEELNIEDYEKL